MEPGEIVRGAGCVSHVDRHPRGLVALPPAGGLRLKAVAALYQLQVALYKLQVENLRRRTISQSRPPLSLCKGR